MRTRLDEIVEHDHNLDFRGLKDNDSVAVFVGALKCSHERAFRHGVEQAKLGASVRDANVYGVHLVVPVFGDVQPAPAGEKCTTFCGHPFDPNVTVCLYPLSRTSVCGMPWSDRRKGERRKHGEAKNYVHDWDCSLPSRLMYQKDTYGAFFYDRRSGKERRR